MNNKSIKNILIVAFALFGIMVVSTLIVTTFNYSIGFSTDVNNNDVSTCIAAVAFVLAVIWKYLYDKMDVDNSK
ncbi:MAG: hypothetical protein KAQ94_10110 [Arcobacteraceae bacterium]|nr:hypothetical protein [Arcobacteraceae bacterium]